MDKDRVKGAIDRFVGSAKIQIGEWTGDTGAQVDGALQKIRGEFESSVGEFKDAARDAARSLVASPEPVPFAPSKAASYSES